MNADSIQISSESNANGNDGWTDYHTISPNTYKYILDNVVYSYSFVWYKHFPSPRNGRNSSSTEETSFLYRGYSVPTRGDSSQNLISVEFRRSRFRTGSAEKLLHILTASVCVSLPWSSELPTIYQLESLVTSLAVNKQRLNVMDDAYDHI